MTIGHFMCQTISELLPGNQWTIQEVAGPSQERILKKSSGSASVSQYCLQNLSDSTDFCLNGCKFKIQGESILILIMFLCGELGRY